MYRLTFFLSHYFSLDSNQMCDIAKQLVRTQLMLNDYQSEAQEYKEKAEELSETILRMRKQCTCGAVESESLLSVEEVEG